MAERYSPKEMLAKLVAFPTVSRDSNLDLEFNSADMVQVFVAGKYEKDEDAGWEEGDWDADLRFNSADMVAAFVSGGYEKGQKPPQQAAAVSAVPEPRRPSGRCWAPSGDVGYSSSA